MSAGSGDDDSLISTRNSSRWVRRSPRVRVAADGGSTCNGGSHFKRVRIPAHNPSNFLKALARAGTNRRATKIVVKKIFLLPPSASKGRTKFQLIKKSAGSWSTYPRVAANVSCWFKLTLGSEMKLTKAVAVEDDRNKKQKSRFRSRRFRSGLNFDGKSENFGSKMEDCWTQLLGRGRVGARENNRLKKVGTPLALFFG